MRHVYKIPKEKTRRTFLSICRTSIVVLTVRSLPSMETMAFTPSRVEGEYMELAKTQGMMSIKDFVRVTEYDIDPLIIDEQWQMLNTRSADELITLSSRMLERLKFSRTSSLINKLEQMFPSPRGLHNEYWGDGVNVSISLNAAIDALKRGRGQHLKKDIKMTKGAYKQLLMETQTDSAKMVRKYYICLEELFVRYLLYQHAYEMVKAERSMEVMLSENRELIGRLDSVMTRSNDREKYLQNVIEQNNSLAIQNEGLSKQLDMQDKKLDALSHILHKVSDNNVMDVANSWKQQELVILQNRIEPEKCEVLRGQKCHVNLQLKRKLSRIEIVGRIEGYKNPINLYNRFSERTKRNKDGRFEIVNNKVTLKNGTTSCELFDALNMLNDEKYTIADEVQDAL